ncbi:hypothetical protein GCM10010517_70950 [Streptosporangium fragile]|uniref:Uncharacterized protein n=1 Tax=Streptosporangium fragile TaxID=46186 RepID=A0ABN3W880_9ACTN
MTRRKIWARPSRAVRLIAGGIFSVALMAAVFTAPASADSPVEEPPKEESQFASVTGTLKGGEWKKVLSGWGKYTLRYAGRTADADGSFKCYANGIKISSGSLPGEFSHVVIGYGSCFFHSPVSTTYWITPVS